MRKNPDTTKTGYRMYRGGGWGSGSWGARVACRSGDNPGDRGVYLSLRLARTSEPVTTVGGFDEEGS